MKKVTSFIFFWIPSLLFADTIFLRSGSKIDGVIVIDETVKEVRYRYDSGSPIQSEPSENVERIEFSRPPFNYKKGWELFQSGKYSEAIRYFSRVGTKRFIPYAKYFSGIAYQKMGMLDEAIRYFSFFENSRHRLMPQALFRLAEIYFEKKNYKSAEKLFRKLEAMNLGDYWRLRAAYGMGKAYFLQGKFSQARRYYEQVYRRSRGRREVVYQQLSSLARQALGLCYVEEKNYRKAKRIFWKIIAAENTTEEALAGAYLGLGKVYYANKDYKRALLCFLRVVFFFPGSKRAYQEAVRLAAKSFRALGKNDLARRMQSRLSQ